MKKRGRPKGSKRRRLLIKDPIIKPYEIHIDESQNAKNYLLVREDTQKVEGYFTQLSYLIKRIARECSPIGEDAKSLRTFITIQQKHEDELRRLLYHVIDR